MRYFAPFLLVLMVLVTSAHAGTPLKIEIYTIPSCMGCSMAKSLLEEKGIPYVEISIRGRPDLYAQMKERAGGKQEHSMTVPRIFINGKHIGSYSDLSNFDFDALKDEKTPISE